MEKMIRIIAGAGVAALTLFSWLGKAEAGAAACGDRGSNPAQGACFVGKRLGS